MARTSVTAARFNPFTMEELYAPMLRATEQHLKQQDKYDEMANQANIWRYRLPQDENSPSRKAYEKHMERFDAVVKDLDANGIANPSARDNARALMRENPIPAFIETQKQFDQLNEVANKLNPTTTRWIHKPTFDDVFQGNTSLDYVDLNDIEKKSSDTIALVARTITSNPTFERATGTGGQYFTTKSTTGITDAMRRMAEDRKNHTGGDDGQGNFNDEELNYQLDRYNNAIEDIKTYSRINEFYGKDRDDVAAAINRGLLNGSAVTSYGTAQNRSNEIALGWANHNLNERVSTAQLYAQGFEKNDNGEYEYNPEVAAKVYATKKGSGGSKTPLEYKNTYAVYTIGNDGNLKDGPYDHAYSSGDTYKNIQDFLTLKENVYRPERGWSTGELNKKIGDGSDATIKDAILNVYKNQTGIDYKTMYESLSNTDKQKFGISSLDDYLVTMIKEEILPQYDIAIGKDRHREKPEIFIVQKKTGRALSNMDNSSSEQSGNDSERKQELISGTAIK